MTTKKKSATESSMRASRARPKAPVTMRTRMVRAKRAATRNAAPAKKAAARSASKVRAYIRKNPKKSALIAAGIIAAGAAATRAYRKRERVR